MNHDMSHDMKKRILAGLCIMLFLAGAGGSIFLLSASRGTQVNIVRDGTVLYSFDLSAAENKIFDIEYEGRVNTVQIEDGRIRVLDADCPDKVCVHMGWLESKALPIVCLPNHLVIEFTDADGDMDAAVR